jgi:hypothetical protein
LLQAPTGPRRTAGRLAALALALTLLAWAAAIAGCGGLEPGFRGSRVLTPPGVSQATIDRYPAAGPERALLSWCRDLQAGAAGAAARWPAAATVFRSAGCPAIRDVERRRDTATAYTVLERRRIAPDDRIDTSVQAQAFHLVRRAGRWSVVEDPLLSGAGAAPVVRGSTRARLPRLVGPADLAAQRPGGAARAALGLLRSLQFNDPTAAAAVFGPAWRLTPERVADYLRRSAPTVRGWGVPPVLSERRRGSETLVVAMLGHARAAFSLARGGEPRRWQLLRVRIGPLVLPDPTIDLGG